MKVYLICAIAALGVGLVILLTMTAGGRARQDAARSKAGLVIAQGSTKAATDATTVVIDQNAAENASADLTRRNDAEIRKAPGADAAVQPGVDLAGRRALCLRRAYIDQPACKQLLDARP